MNMLKVNRDVRNGRSATNEIAPIQQRFFDKDLERYVLQEIIFASRGQNIAQDIYFQALEGDVQSRSGNLEFAAGGKVGLNNYVNSFFSAYWVEYTALDAISLSGAVSGSGTLDLYHSSAKGRTKKIGSFPIGKPGEDTVFHIPFNLHDYLPSDGSAGRHFFDIQATSPMMIRKMAFSACVPPKRNPQFSLGICTYRKETYVTNLIYGLENYISKRPDAFRDIFIVNNDNNFDKLEALEDVASKHASIKLVAQSNIGGAGGFARTLEESLAKSDSDYHIFMDDDVFVDFNIFDRLRAFVAYSRKDHIVGGQMLNMDKPEILYEGGGSLDYWGFLSKVGENINAGHHSEITYFDQIRKVDYNAWWFACVPKSTCRKIGLPLNIFIRGDDFEFGLRMREEGVSTISLPGIFVWHEPFEGKTSVWLEYYNWRNRFIICSIFGDEKTLDIQPPDMLRDILVEHMEAERFDLVLVICLAILDFLGGPEKVLLRHAGTHHNELSAMLKADLTSMYATKTLDKVLAGFTQTTNDMQRLYIRNSSRLGGRQRQANSIKWIESDLVSRLDEVLTLYATSVGTMKSTWKSTAHNYATRESWRELYLSETKDFP